MLVSATLTALLLIGLEVALLGNGPSSSGPATASTETTPAASSLAPQPSAGPEGVPLTGGAPLGPASAPARGKSRAGVPCGSTEQLTYHVHARLTLFVAGKPRSIPLGVGIGRPLHVTKSSSGSFASGGRCFSFLHTHAADGVIHIESPGPVRFRLGQFFDVWRQRLDSRHLGPNRGRVVAFVDGRRYHGDPRAIPLRKHVQIQLEVGQPVRPPHSIAFPPNL